MARNLLYHLNRLQDVLSLPRTVSGNYPVDADPLHSDTILTEDIWEASKVVTGDLSRRGLMDVVSTATPIIKGQNAYSLPSNICKLLSVEYFDGIYWKGPLTSISYDDYTRISEAKTEGTPTYYTQTISDSREVYITVNSGVTESSFRDTGPIVFTSGATLTTTTTGNQINKGDLIFNTTQDSGGKIECLDMSTPRLTTTTAVTNSSVNYETHTIVFTSDDAWALNGGSHSVAGDIIKQGKTWAVITGAVHEDLGAGAGKVTLTFDGIIRGASDSFSLLTSSSSNGNWTSDNVVTIGPPDVAVVQSDDTFVLDANQGMSGATSNVSFSSVGLDTYISTFSGSSYTMNVSRTGEDIDLTEYANKGYILSYTESGVAYKAYIGNVIQAVGSDPFQSNLYLYYDSSLGSAVGVINTSTNTSSVATFVTANAFSILKPDFFVGDVVQIESQFATLDTIQVYPYPGISDVVGAEGLRMTYVPYPVKPNKVDHVIELPDTFNDAVLSKAHEYATRREVNRVEPYEESIRRATSTARPVPNTGLMRNRRGAGNRVINFVVPS